MVHDAIKAKDDPATASDAGDGHTYKFVRGGSWTSGNLPQGKWRFCIEPTVMRNDVGFRVVLAKTPKPGTDILPSMTK